MIKIIDGKIECSNKNIKIERNIITINDSTEVLFIEGYNNDEIIINVKANLNIIEKNINNSNLIINIFDDLIINYQIVSFFKQRTNREFNLKENSKLELLEINLNENDNNLIINLNETNASLIYSCLAINKGNNATFNQIVNHNNKHTYSEINNFGVALDKAFINFNTTGKITQGNKGSTCSQLSKGIITNNGKISTNPILLIDEYDVKAYHGATIGKMSDEQLFYLMSRGLNKQEAFTLILLGTINPFINGIKDFNLKEEVENSIKNII